ncbi:uncharacterized protein E0L32_007706 [Thyridium curvatum]|uniref:Arrestin-like N-terminal domain-containing protein n=1 Tax=Thyridium curvatum TaxID=1093900 RepID=A0A507ALK4_9PEZI|nr:uncharacterized protein E0L32_007706 [Thyridium curvatum]TPX11495.1 hypothetical protein E0L32_007706 [Thyridium curvatum]
MSQAEFKASEDLAIQLDNFPTAYRPGETISGRVLRKTQTASPRAGLDIALLGRTKARVHLVHARDLDDYYNSPFHFFDRDETLVKVHDGPLHIPGSELQSWPFAITIPTNLSPKPISAAAKKEHSYLPLDPAEIAKRPLPSSYSFNGQLFDDVFSGHVEYWLEARFRSDGEATRPATASMPVMVRARSTPYPVTDHSTKRCVTRSFVTSHRLAPGGGAEGSGLSLKQRAQKLMGSSKVPELVFHLEIGCPTVIQLDHPKPFPFELRVVPIWDQTSGVLKELPQKVRIKGLDLQLKESSSVLCPGTLAPRGGNDETIKDFALARVLKEEDFGSFLVPFGADAQPFDIGEQLQLKVASSWATALGRPPPQKFIPGLFPSFTTYNVAHRYRLQWCVTLVIAGETVKVNGEHNTSLLARSEEQGGQSMYEVGYLGVQKKYKEWMGALGAGSLVSGGPPPTFEASTGGSKSAETGL